MRPLILAMAMASTLFTPTLASAADRPGDRAERRHDVRADRYEDRRDRRYDKQERKAERRDEKYERKADKAERRYDRRAERRDDRYDRRDVRTDRRDDRIERRAERRWDQNWRQDRRYDYARYRARNRAIYSPGRYYAADSRRYQRPGIGYAFGRSYYNDRYRIDANRYRLPPAYGAYRWVRYYNDAVLVNTRSGRVADVIYRFFY